MKYFSRKIAAPCFMSNLLYSSSKKYPTAFKIAYMLVCIRDFSPVVAIGKDIRQKNYPWLLPGNMLGVKTCLLSIK